ncbi:MAG: hypothetical protein HQL58_05570 [Magnetococcales bacterium]|nr:hypothetical protein [Magnetococcales bacterium]
MRQRFPVRMKPHVRPAVLGRQQVQKRTTRDQTSILLDQRRFASPSGFGATGSRSSQQQGREWMLSLLTGVVLLFGRSVVWVLQQLQDRRSGGPDQLSAPSSYVVVAQQPQLATASGSVMVNDLSPELVDIIGSWNHIDVESVNGFMEDEELMDGWELELAKMSALDEEEKALSRDELEDQAAWLRSRSGMPQEPLR